MPLNEPIQAVSGNDCMTHHDFLAKRDVTEFTESEDFSQKRYTAEQHFVGSDPFQLPTHSVLIETLASLQASGHANNQLFSVLTQRTTSIEASLSVVLAQQQQLISILEKVVHVLCTAEARNQNTCMSKHVPVFNDGFPIRQESQNTSGPSRRDVILPPESPPLLARSTHNFQHDYLTPRYLSDYCISMPRVDSIDEQQAVLETSNLGPVQQAPLWHFTPNFY